MRVCYLDCISGVAGDMTLAALVDAGADLDAIRRGLARLDVEPFELERTEVRRAGLRATRVEVRSAAASRPHRTRADIDKLLETAGLPPHVTERALAVFARLAEAEGRVHGMEPDDVELHEVGSVDAIVDVVGVSLALDQLGIERVEVSPVPLGSGWARGLHGDVPVPGPAVVELLRGLPVRPGTEGVEHTTPTGAAIVAVLGERFGPVPPMRLTGVGYGAGSRDLERPNVLRALVGESDARVATGTGVEPAVVLETNVDDLNPELYGHVVERLLAAGARDAWLSPVVMKKGRPGTIVSALAEAGSEDVLLEVLFRETGTLGVRTSPVLRHVLDRETLRVATPHGDVRVKAGLFRGRVVTLAPEYEDCAEAARRTGTPAKEVYEAALRTARDEATRRWRNT